MGRGSSSSQVGLFSTQISEQIVRLRALTAGGDGPTEAQQVDIRRAVMATRLLAGSARILGLAPMQEFLDELLAWLQRVEQAGSPLTTTQSLILESVVELEESLMLHLDEAGADANSLSVFVPQIEDLLSLIRHNVTVLEGEKKSSSRTKSKRKTEVEEQVVADPVPDAPVEERPTETAESSRQTSLDAAIDDFVHAIETASGKDSTLLLSQAESASKRLAPIVERLRERVRHIDRTPTKTRESKDKAIEDPAADAVFGAAVTRLREAAKRTGVSLEVEAFGGASLLAPSQHSTLSTILLALCEDLCQDFVAMAGISVDPIHVALEIRVQAGHAVVCIRDSGPRLEVGTMLGETDHLAALAGLRRARAMLEQGQGLIRIGNGETDAPRFQLTLPLDPDHPQYSVLELEEGRVAVASSLLERTLGSAGLRYEGDEVGESVQIDKKMVPVVDLAAFVEEVLPVSAPLPRIAVVGAVEKRLALGCRDVLDPVEVDALIDPPSAWAEVAYGALEFEGEVVPVLDLRRLMSLRFGGGRRDLSGAFDLTQLDSFVPVGDAPVSPGEQPRGRRRALLVNQSEFRRRELARILQEVGLEVRTAADLSQAMRALELEPIDLLVTDLRLGQDASGTLKKLRARYADLEVVLTSSVAKQYAAELAERTGADHCWLDPYRKSDLKQLLVPDEGA